MAKTSPKMITLDPNLYISIVDADFYFSVQKAFQALGVLFIDLNDGHIIRGHANIDTLGMLSKLPPEKPQKSYGIADRFLIPPNLPKIISYDVEATINIYEPKDSDEPCIFTIQIVNQNDLEVWYKIVAEVGKLFVEFNKFENKVPKAVFRLIPLAVPDETDPLSAISAMLGNIQRYRAGGYLGSAISNNYLELGEDDWMDGEEDVQK